MQQINLYKPRSKKASFELNAKQMATLILIGVLAMTGVSGWQWYQLTQLRADSVKLFDRKNEATTALAETKAKQTPPAIDKQLADSVVQHERLLAGKRALVQLITELPSGATAGFSRYLEALGKQYVKGLWLHTFEFKDGGRVINLYGNTQTAALVPDYLQKLSQEQAFQGKTFGGLKLERENDSKHTSFAITTKPLNEREEKAR